MLNKIDYLVFEHVFNNEKGYVDYLKEIDGGNIVRPYSTETKYALDVVDKMNLTITPRWRVFRANAGGGLRDIHYIGTTNNQDWAEHRSLSMAICLAALKEYGINDLKEDADKIINDIEKALRIRKEEVEQILGYKLQ